MMPRSTASMPSSAASRAASGGTRGRTRRGCSPPATRPATRPNSASFETSGEPFQMAVFGYRAPLAPGVDIMASAANSDRPTVLVVEYEFIIALDLSETVKDLGYALEGPFTDNENAFLAIESEMPDCAILDVY